MFICMQIYTKYKYRIDRVNKLRSECIYCRFEIIMVIDEECYDDYMKTLSVKEKLCYHLLKTLTKN